MTPQEQHQKYQSLYKYMANSQNPENMKVFGNVMTEMMEWMISNKSDAAQEWIDKLESIKWKNYLTPKEAERIVSEMVPKAPWSREQWKTEMTRNGFVMEEEPCYNSCSLWAEMNAIMSDSSGTIGKYVNSDELFGFVHDLAVDKLTDEDKVFSIRRYFNV